MKSIFEDIIGFARFKDGMTKDGRIRVLDPPSFYSHELLTMLILESMYIASEMLCILCGLAHILVFSGHDVFLALIDHN